jgi:uncharacterized protein (TIGR02001 family)
MTKTFLGAASLVCSTAALCAGNAYADDGILGPDFSATAAVAVQSDYRFRGISQNDKQPTPEATLNLFGPDGFYAGTWWAKTNWNVPRPSGGANNPSMEADFYFGKNTKILDSNLNVEAYYYSYPDFNAGGGPEASFFEIITQLSHDFGMASVTGTWAYSPEFSLGGGTGNYLAGNVSVPLNDWLSLSANVGHQWVQSAKYALGTGGDYTHADIGGTLTYRALALDLRYVTTDMTRATCGFYMGTWNACSGGFTGTLTYTISNWPW